MDSDAKIGILGCRTLVPDGILQPTFHSASRHAFFVRRPAKWDPPHILMFGANLDKRRALMQKYERSHGYDQFCEVPALSGVCLLIRREVFRDVGLLDETFFMYHEDTDFCLRARRAGWKVCYTPSAVAHHFIRKKENKGSSRLLAEAWFSRFYFVRKHFGAIWGALLLARYCLQTIFYFIYGALRVATGRESRSEWRERWEWRWQAIMRSAVFRFDRATPQSNASPVKS
jgi:GT2 family glycosyltransferase